MRVLNLGGAQFPLRDELPKSGSFMVLSKRLATGNSHEQMAALYDHIVLWVTDTTGTRDGEPVHIDTVMMDMEIDDIQKAVAAAVRQFSDRPTKRSSASAAGSQPTAGTSRVVSLSRGTVETESTSLTG